MTRKLGRRSPFAQLQPQNQCRKRSLGPGRVQPRPAMPLPPIKEPRLLCSELITLQLSEPGSAPREITGILEEISPDSACVQVEECVRAESPVRLVLSDATDGEAFTGIVVECFGEKNLGFYAEIRFAKGCVWSVERYRPLHLFDPNGLLADDETTSEA